MYVLGQGQKLVSEKNYL